VVAGLRGGGTRPAAMPGAGARLAEIGQFLGRPPFLVLLACGLALSCVQSSLMAYLTLFARETMALSVVTAAGLLAAAQVGGTLGRLGWGAVSDRAFGGRRRPGVVINACLGAATYLVFASGAAPPLPVAAAVAVLAGVGAFGWMGLYLALAAEVGGARHAGLLTGVAVAAAWSGVLIGPPLFGALLELTGTYHWPWTALAAVSALAAAALHRLPPLVQR
jgi:MFS family permease